MKVPVSIFGLVSLNTKTEKFSKKNEIFYELYFK